MRTNYVLIDLENVQPAALDGLAADHFKVVVFVGANQTKLPFDLVDAVLRLGSSRAELIKISGSGRNALDFHIAYYIGRLAERDSNTFFHIISKDSGFDPLIAHLKDVGVLSARSARIEDIPLLKVASPMSVADRAVLVVATLSKPKATKPRTTKTLAAHVGATFQKKLSDAEVQAVIDLMEKQGFLTTAGGKVAYSLTPAVKS